MESMSDATTPGAAAPVSRPTQIEARTWSYVGRRTVQEFIADGCVDAAAGLTFFAVLSVFPAGLAIVASISYFGDGEAVLDRMLALLEQVAPRAVTDTLRGPLVDVAGASVAGFTLVVSIVVAIWSASIYVGAFGRALNRIYGVTEGRPYWKRKPAQLGVTIILMLLVIVVIGVIALSGPIASVVGDALGIGESAQIAWDVVKWPLLAVAVVALTSVLYKGTSNVRQPRFRWLSVGALLAILVLGAASAGLAFYVANFADYNRTFGALAGIIIFLLWLFLVNAALLLGAEFNVELERGRQLQSGLEAEEHLELPRRDTTASERVARSRDITLERGTAIRRGEELPARPDSLLRRARAFVSRLTERLRPKE